MDPSTDNHSFSLIPYVNHSNKMEEPLSDEKKITHSQLQKIIDNSFQTQFKDYAHFGQYGMGDLVVLVGTSTAGKTSIIRALKELESNRIEDGVDLRFFATALKIIIQYNPNEVEILRKVMKTPFDIPHAVHIDQRSWKTGISIEDKMEAEKAIKQIQKTHASFSEKEFENIDNLNRNIELEMFDDVLESTRRGKNIIFDVLNTDALAKHILMRNFNGPMRVVLTYCPFKVLSSRMERRNTEAVASGELHNQRIGDFPLRQFSEVYTKKEKGQRTFERLTRDQVIRAFDENFDKGIAARHERDLSNGRVPKSPEEILREKEERRDTFLNNLGFKEGVDAVEVSPKNQDFYDFVVDSSRLTAEESAEIIHKGTYQRYQQ